MGKSIYFSMPASSFEAIKYFTGVSAKMFVDSPSNFKIINFDKVADAFIKLKKESGAFLPEGESVIEIKDWGNLFLCNKKGEAFCEKTDKAADFSFDRLEATRFLFGPFEPNTVKTSNAFLSALLPLPLSWCCIDRV